MPLQEGKGKRAGILFLICFLISMGISLRVLIRYAKEGEESNGRMGENKISEYGKDFTEEEFLVRVQICTSEYREKLHETLEVQCEEGFLAEGGGWKKEVAPGETWSIRFADYQELEKRYGTKEEAFQIRITPLNNGKIRLANVERGSGDSVYEGSFFLEGRETGMLLVNVLPLESYLGSVVASEMPSSYPMEAQKAQAVCARTYALNFMKNREKQETAADLDDSVSFQVYNNYQETERSRRAVEETAGKVMDLEEVWYYSTSCGTSKEDLSKEEAFQSFLLEEPEQEEYDSPWLRWETEIPADQVLTQVNRKYGSVWDKLLDVRVEERSVQGQIQKLYLKGDAGELLVEGEYAVREVLGGDALSVTLSDGSRSDTMELLPSAFFYLEPAPDAEITEICTLKIHGGGYGHGLGMSQCGAAQMAEEGADYQEILEFYYGEGGKVHEMENGFGTTD